MSARDAFCNAHLIRLSNGYTAKGEVFVKVQLTVPRQHLCEPPRDCRRLQLLSRRSHYEQDNEQIFAGGSR